MRLGYELTIEQTQKLSMTPELIQAIQILQFNNQELSDYIQNELLENPVLEAEKSDGNDEIDIREKIAESEYELDTYRQWESSADDDDNDYTYEQYAALPSAPTADELMRHVKYLNPFTEMYAVEGLRNPTREQLDSIVENGFTGCRAIIKNGQKTK